MCRWSGDREMCQQFQSIKLIVSAWTGQIASLHRQPFFASRIDKATTLLDVTE